MFSHVIRVLRYFGFVVILLGSTLIATAYHPSNAPDVDTLTWELAFAGPANYVFSHLAVYNNKLYVGGSSNTQDNGRLYVYDGNSWTNTGFSPTDGVVDAVGPMEVLNGRLYIGTRVNVNGSAYARVYYYNGSTFTQDLSVPAMFGCAGIEDLIVHNSTLYAARGSCGNGNVYQRRGDSDWLTLGGVPGNDAARSLASFGGNLYVGTGTSGSQAKVWRWNGSSWELAVNIASSFGVNQDGVWSLASANGLIYAGIAGPGAQGPIAVYDGTTWTSNLTASAPVRLATVNNQLWAYTNGANGGVFVDDGISWKSYGQINPQNTDYAYDFISFQGIVYAATGNAGRIYRMSRTPLQLSIAPPTIADAGELVYVPVFLHSAQTSDDVRGIQFGVRVNKPNIFSPANDRATLIGDLFPTNALTYTVAITDGWDYMLNALSLPASAISGTGIIVQLPFYARSEGCVDLTFADHLLTNGSAQLISHQVMPGRICVQDKGNLRGTTYLQGRTTGHFTGTLVTATGARGTYTTTTDAAGNFTFTDIYSGTYTAHFTHTLFVHAVRSVITVTGQTTTTVPEVGLWAGDMNQDGDVDNPDWYVCAAASIPVDDPAFDINDDRATDIRDCTLLGNNIGRPNMPTTNPPKTGVAASAQGSQGIAGIHVGRIVAVPLGAGETLLRAVDVNGQLFAAGIRLGLPAGANVTHVELRDGFAGGFLRWHQDNGHLYIVAAPREDATLTQNTDVVHLRFTGTGAATIEASSSVGEPKPVHSIYLPVVVRH